MYGEPWEYASGRSKRWDLIRWPLGIDSFGTAAVLGGLWRGRHCRRKSHSVESDSHPRTGPKDMANSIAPCITRHASRRFASLRLLRLGRMSGGLTLPSEACLRVCGILFVDVVLPSAVLYTSAIVEQLRRCVRKSRVLQA